MRKRQRLTRSLVTALGLTACRCGTDLANANSAVSVGPPALDFGNVYLQAAPVLSVTALNGGDAPDAVTVTLLADAGSPFSVPGGSVTLAGGSQAQIPVGFAPTHVGAAAAALRVSWSNGATTVGLRGNALAWPDCAPAGPCETATFEPATGVCNQQPVADGTDCDGGDVCLSQTRCVSGQCLGQLASCAQDACTLGYCVPGEGCQSQDQSAKCQGTDPCQVYSCDPRSGCLSVPAVDGTPCSLPQNGCKSAGACLSGACVGVAVPDGTPCALWWAPCVPDATCAAGVCDSPTADALQPGQPLWAWVDAGFMIDDSASGGMPVAADDLGTSYLPYLPYPYGDSAAWAAIDSCGHTLWTVPWPSSGVPNGARYGASLAAGQLVAWANDHVAGLVPASGALLWETDLTPAAIAADGYDGGFLGVSAESLSSQGTMYFEGWHCCDVDQFVLFALGPSGAVQWTQPVPFDSNGPLLSDSAGNVYFDYDGFYVDGGAWQGLQSFDDLGQPRFLATSTGAASALQAIGANDLLSLDFTYSAQQQASAVDVSALTLNGQARYGPVDALPLVDGITGTVVDAAGTAYVSGLAPPPDGGTSSGAIVAIAASGSVLWALDLPAAQVPISMPALGDGNTLFLVTTVGNYYFSLEDWLLGIDTATGTLLWQADLGADPSPAHGGGDPGASLALTAAGELLVSNSLGVSAYFAGRHKPPVGAPWPREGGDNSNRWSPAASGP